MFEAVVIVKALMEVALLGLAGQGLLHMLAGKNREQNVFYQLVKAVATPPMSLAKLISPPIFPPLWVGCVAFSICGAIWVVATYYKICLSLNTC
ncbi:MAG: hypothetical protein ACKVQK_18755 [Burkholderiales bacterium]